MVKSLGDTLGAPRSSRGARTRREQRFSTRAFWWTCFLLVVLALLALWPERRYGTLSAPAGGSLLTRDLATFKAEKSDEVCRLVHKPTITDKCAFVRRHCPDEEPGFLTYLDFYYCTMAGFTPAAFMILVIWLATLFSTIGIAASDFFCINLSTLATILGMSESLAGVTFLAFGNGSPDVFSTFAAMSTNSSSLAIGELIGAAGFITAVVAGSMALVRPFKVGKKSFVRDVGFFAIAAAFSMGFLADGNLHLWECIVMVCYYIFYVTVVVAWHWWSTRRARRRERNAAARGHYVIPGSEEVEVEEEYRDDPDERSTVRPPLSRGVSAEDFRALEEAGKPHPETLDVDGLDEEDAGRLMSELATNMQLRRHGRTRKSTITAVRPSLMGALEFQAVLGNLQKSRNMHTIPLNQRRHTDDVTHTLDQDDAGSVASAPEADLPLNAAEVPTAATPGMLLAPANGRIRAVSTNDISVLRADPNFLGQSPRLREIQEHDPSRLNPFSPMSFKGQPDGLIPASAGTATTKTLSPKTAVSPANRSPERKVRPNPTPLGPMPELPPSNLQSYLKVPGSPERTVVQDTKAASRPKLHGLRIPSAVVVPSRSSPGSPFPAYRDDPSSPNTRAPSIHLPPASVPGATQSYFDDDSEADDTVAPPSWWPSFLPTPRNIMCTLAPTLYPWRTKSWFQLALGLVAAPSVLLLAITLPVVEVDPEDEDEIGVLDSALNTPRLAINGTSHEHDGVLDSSSRSIPDSSTPLLPGTAHGSANTAAKIEDHHHHHNSEVTSSPGPIRREAPAHPHRAPKPRLWNRWLIILQLYLAPIMMVLILYTQYLDLPKGTTFSRAITRPILIGLLVSTILLIPLLVATRPDHRPKALIPILSLAGFVVSIAWISTIASQVVAVLKAFAIILNMSHAILGLTVFAVGNSLGDLVADITVARLGYPVMALSACFGGPMLNILLGIGLSGCWQLMRRAQRRVDKGKEWQSGTFQIEVGETLIVSGVTLLVTLVGLLVAVPLNGWVMSKRIAWALIALWCVGTILNVVLEVMGVGSKHGHSSSYSMPAY